MTAERWYMLSPAEQLRHTAAGTKRAALYEASDPKLARTMMEHVLELIDLSLGDARWRTNPRPLLLLRDLIADAYANQKPNLNKAYACL